MAREPRKILALRDMGQRRRVCRRQRARSAHVDVEARIRRRYLNVEGLADRREHFGNVPGRRDRSAERWREDGTAVDRHHVMRLERGKAHLEHVARDAAGVGYGAAAPPALSIDQVAHWRIQPRSWPRGGDPTAL